MSFLDTLIAGGWLVIPCILCNSGAEPSGICADCHKLLPFIGEHCLLCSLPCSGPVCGRCQRSATTLDGAQCGLRYEWPVNTLLNRFKHHGDLTSGRALVECSLQRRALLWSAPLIPVPLHPDKLRRRGFNQAERIARLVATKIKVPVITDLITRSNSGSDQKSLGRSARQQNLLGAFRVHRHPPEVAVLIDDVMTTGATLNAVASALKNAGTRKVYAWCLARTL